MSSLIGPVLDWLPKVFFGGVFLLSFLIYWNRGKFEHIEKKFYLLAILTIYVRALYAVTKSASQYLIWQSVSLTKLLLPPHESISYYLFYVWGRFWLNPLITFAAAAAFCFFLKFLKKYRERFFEEGEIELGLLLALIVGWPNFVIFLPAACVFVVILSIIRGIFLKETFTTLGFPLIIGTLISLIWGANIIDFLNLGVLRI